MIPIHIFYKDAGVKGEGQVLANKLTLFQPCGADYAHHITTADVIKRTLILGLFTLCMAYAT